jgi:hypothetical protein
MKKSILIVSAVLATLGLAAIGFLNWNNVDSKSCAMPCAAATVNLSDNGSCATEEPEVNIFYNVATRWSTMTKEELNKVTTIDDLLIPRKDNRTRDSYTNVLIAVLNNDKDARDITTSAMGQGARLNVEQLNILRSSDYSTNIRITALSMLTDHNGDSYQDSLVRYMTIAPEIQADYEGGLDAVVDYLKEGCKGKTGVIKADKLQPAKVFFTVTKEGAIGQVKLVETSGYPSVDEELVKIVSKMPELWTPAANSKGERVDQEFVFSFGTEGC